MHVLTLALSCLALAVQSSLAEVHSLSISHKPSHKPILSSYWPAYYSEEVQSPSAFPWKYNDAAYYFVTITTNGTSTFELGPSQPVKDVKKFTNNAKKHGVKSLVSIGGWSGSIYFSDLVSTKAKRDKFVKDIKTFVDKYGFDGVDLDWEYPNAQGIGCNSIRKTDSAHFLSFLKSLRKALGGRQALITAAVATTPFNGPDGEPLSDVSEFAKQLSWINLMTYDISGSWSATTGPNSPLRTCKADTSVEQAVSTWEAAGFPSKQIMVGQAAYAHSFTTKSSTLKKTNVTEWYPQAKESSVMYQDFVGIPKGNAEDVVPTTDECGVTSNEYAGSWQYYELIAQGMLSSCGKEGLNGWKRYFDECTATPILFNAKKKYFITYDDEESARAEAEFARKKGLGGIFIFDSAGFKGSNGILKSIRKELGI